MLKYFLGKPTFIYSPEEFGDDFTKKTALWGNFSEPMRVILRSPLKKGRSVKDIFTPMSHKRNWEEITDERSRVSPLFAKAFFEANQ